MRADPAAIATEVVRLARDGRFAEIEDRFAPPLRAAVSARTLQAAWATETGAVHEVGRPTTEPGEAGLVRVSVPVVGERGDLTVVMSVDDAGALHGLRLTASTTTSWTPPPYATPKRFAEQEVVVGSGPHAVPGTLTLPRGHGSRPGVVLLSGGGPFDRDATSGANKPLKDLAWGLASRGVAVLRHDKITHTHRRVATEPGFTMSDEYVPHAVAAVRALRQQPTVDAERVFVLGHSMGGKVAPRVAAALATVVEQAAFIDSPALTPASPTADLLMGLPASYWLDLRSYDPAAAAAALDRPMLILQGGRDYQVTVEDDLARWQEALAGRPDVTIRLHAADNHLFFPGDGPSTPAEYDPPQHVDPAVVADIAEWLAPSRGWIGRFRRHR